MPIDAAVAVDTPNASTLEAFKASLPDVPAREMWAHETYLEYRRFIALRDAGATIHPKPTSLLGLFLSFQDGGVSRADNTTDYSVYISTFGYQPPYCWNKDVSALTIESATGSAPNGAWMHADE